ncbi:autotransporter outer membrane beta-barrel domain-containing protein [Salinispora mooreana]|uniref:hypothetical protein n=1 Tax=Salinispora mooreana TaxID=999545 RepID=UPI0006AD02DD|nr:hypothetical protein [Salinispora mooreana]
MNDQRHEHKPDRPGARRARSRWWAVGLAGMTSLALTTVGVATATPAADASEHPTNTTDDRTSADDHRGKRDGGKHDNWGRGKDDIKGMKEVRPKGIPVPCDADKLIAAITLANARGGAVLDLAKKCTYLLTVAIDDAGLPAITAPITLSGGKNTTIERAATAPLFRILTVEAGGDLTFHHLKITGGHTDDSGGGILVNAGGALTANHSTISHNIANVAGGGIDASGTVRVRHSTVSHNTANSGGGGINVSSGLLTVSKSRVDANTALLFGGGIASAGTTRVDHSTITGNQAPSGGGLVIGTGTGTVTNTHIMSNTATAGGGVTAVGGGAYTFRSVVIADNTATTGASGGLFMDFGMTMVIEDGVIENNAAATDGGGIANNGDLVLRDTKVTGNTANDQGGGIYNTSIVTVFDGKVIKNIATVDGGGIVNNGGAVELNTATGTVVAKNRPNNCVNVTGCPD